MKGGDIMTDKQDKHEAHEKKTGVSPIAAAVTGAVVGAGVAVVGVKAMEDEKTREKVKQVLENARDQAVQYVQNAQKKMPAQGKDILQHAGKKIKDLSAMSEEKQQAKKK